MPYRSKYLEIAANRYRPAKADVEPDPPQSQAERVIARFGGARRLAEALRRLGPDDSLNPSSIYRWNYPVEKGGSAGQIPTRAMHSVMKAARFEGILLTPDDLYPGTV